MRVAERDEDDGEDNDNDGNGNEDDDKGSEDVIDAIASIVA